MSLRSVAIAVFSTEKGDDLLRLDRAVSRAALRIQKAEQPFERVEICAIAQERLLPLDGHEILMAELLEVMRQGRSRHAGLRLDLVDDKAVGVSGEKEPHDSEPRLGAERREHIREAGNFLVGDLHALHFYNYRNVVSSGINHQSWTRAIWYIVAGGVAARGALRDRSHQCRQALRRDARLEPGHVHDCRGAAHHPGRAIGLRQVHDAALPEPSRNVRRGPYPDW